MRNKTVAFLTALSLLPVSLPLKAEIIKINTNNSSMILRTVSSGELQMCHYGATVSNPEVYKDYESYRRTDHGTDGLAYPAAGGRYVNEPALSATYADGCCNTILKYQSCSTEKAEGCVTTRVLMKDPKTSLEVTLVYEAWQKEDVILAHTEIRNAGKKPVTLNNYYSSALYLKANKYLLTHFYGSWAREMLVDREVLTHGMKTIESKMGVRTTHLESPSFLLSLNTSEFQENSGEVIAGTLAWSGNYKLNFQMVDTGGLYVISGINPFSAAYTLGKGEMLQTPDMVYTYSAQGAGQASRNLHDWARRSGCYSAEMTPCLLNSWEGAYFDFDTKTITKMIDDAAGMGLELFVLDDGWFGNKYPRNNSRQGLGDWETNIKKLPEGIDYLANYAHGKGLKFGIWIEPEMVNPKSELFEKHPDWVVYEQGREHTLMRNQLILDLCNPEVQDFVFGVFDRTMQLSKNIDYIKWDANRHVECFGSNYLKEQSQFWVKYVQGFYNVMRRIREKYPDVLIQACSSGGGRMEYGALKYFNEYWTSDDTEARHRTFIQYGTGMIFPAHTMGSHVSATPNHQTGNVTPLKFRFDVAASGRLGMELQPKSMTEEEVVFARKAIASYKQYRDLVSDGDLYRLLSPYDTDYYSLMYVSKDKKRAVVFAYCLEYQGRVGIPHIRLHGLDRNLEYNIRELNVEKPLFWADGKTLKGDYLIEEGINPKLLKIYDSAVFYLEAR